MTFANAAKALQSNLVADESQLVSHYVAVKRINFCHFSAVIRWRCQNANHLSDNHILAITAED